MIRKYKWGFEVHDTPWSESLSHRDIGPDVAIVRDEMDAAPPQFLFTSQHLNDLDDPREVRARAMRLLVLFNGAMYLTRGLAFQPESLGSLIDFKNDRRVGHQDPAPSGVVFSAKVTAAPFGPLKADETERYRFEAALWLARTDPVVFGMLETLDTGGVTYHSLYALRDFLNTAKMDDEAIRSVTGASAKQFKTFTHTANSFAAIGTASRHGLTNQQPPAAPMSIPEAANLILPAVGAFIDKRALRASQIIPATL